MEREAFQKLITNIVAVLNNYLLIAKQSGRITIILDSVNGDVKRCVVGNSLELNLDQLKEKKGA